MDQWTNGSLAQWTNGPMVQWTNAIGNGQMDKKLLRPYEKKKHIGTLEHRNIRTFEYSTFN